MQKIFVLNEEAKKKIKSGIDKVCNAVKLSLGPSGRTAIIGRPYQTPLITTDGKAIADAITLDDEIEQLGKEVLDDALDRAESELGNGRKTTTILFQTLTDKGFSLLETSKLVSKNDPIKVKDQITEEVSKALEILKIKVREVKTKEDIINVATIAIQNKEIGKEVADIFEKLGPDAHIQIEDSAEDTVSYKTIKGLELGAGFPTHNFSNQGNDFISKNPYVLVTNEPIHSEEQVRELVEITIKNEKRPIIILGENFSKEITGLFATEHIEDNITIIPIKPPVFSDVELFKDYASMLGAKFIDKEVSSLKDITLEDLGTCDKVVIDKDKTVFVGTPGDTTKRVREIKEKVKSTTSAFEKDTLNKRIAKLSGGVGLIYVGGKSQKEKDYIKMKIKDGVRTTKLALEEGIVKGGGVALKEVAEEMKESIIYEALMSPYLQIQKNAGGNLTIGEEVIDAYKIIRSALDIASNLAGYVITTEIAIADKRKEDKEDEA